MESSSGAPAQPDELAGLAASARAPSARTRLGVGAAIVLFLVALVVAVVISAVGSGSVTDRVPLGESGSGAGSIGVASEPSRGSISTAGGDPFGATDGAAEASDGVHIFVHVLGAVTSAGLYELTEGARVIDVVAAAGGFADDADPGGVNLARELGDGEQLYVPRIGEVPPPVAADNGGADATRGGSSSGSGVVNLNSATQADLETLPRIGPSLAQRILNWREANGGFASVDDLRNVTGIGEKTFDGLKDLVTV